MATHASLTGADLHEPKGVAGASANTVYLANGSGSGAWSVYPEYISITLDFDIHNDATYYVAIPFTGTVDKIYSVLEGSSGSGSTTISFSNNGTPVTDGDIAVSNADAAGTIDDSTPSANNNVTAGTYFAITNTKSGTGGSRMARVTIRIRRTA